MKIIFYDQYGGIDWHDSCSITEYLKDTDGSYDIKSDPDEIIATNLYDMISQMKETSTEKGVVVSETYLKSYPASADEIFKLIKKGEVFGYESEPDKEFGVSKIYVSYDPAKKELSYGYCYGQISYSGTFVEDEIADEDVRYFVCENILAPNKGIPSVLRFYEEPYTDLNEALTALDNLELKNYNSRKELIIQSEDKSNPKWLQANRLCNQVKEELGDVVEYSLHTENYLRDAFYFLLNKRNLLKPITCEGEILGFQAFVNGEKGAIWKISFRADGKFEKMECSTDTSFNPAYPKPSAIFSVTEAIMAA